MSDLLNYAKSELDRIKKDEDGMQEEMNKDILEIIEKFCDQGHSGFSAGYALKILDRLLRYKPISPLTGEDDEWVQVAGFPNTMYQNKRCSSVFKDENGKSTDNDGIAVSDNGGITWFHSKKFEKEVTFPYYPPIHPEKVYIEYTESVPIGFSGDKYDIITDDPERIKALHDKCRKEMDEAYAEDEKRESEAKSKLVENPDGGPA